jgi:hypothetical protein
MGWPTVSAVPALRSRTPIQPKNGREREPKQAAAQPFFARPPFFDGGGGAFRRCPKPLSFASFDRVAAYSAATIGYDGGRPHFVRYSSGVI